MWQNSAGDYVLHSDYARLKAEVERLRASSFVTAVPFEEYEKLKAEVERLKEENEVLQNRCDFLEGRNKE